MKRIEKARRIIDRVFYIVIFVFSMYCLGTFAWVMNEVVGNLNTPNSYMLEGIMFGFIVQVGVLFLISFADYILKERQIFLMKKVGGFEE